jgi:hypothetical protein
MEDNIDNYFPLYPFMQNMIILIIRMATLAVEKSFSSQQNNRNMTFIAVLPFFSFPLGYANRE